MTGFRKSLRAVLAGSLVFVGVVLAMPAQIASASTQQVTNCNDSGPGSLRQAVLDAASGDTIDFPLSPTCSTIVLASTIDITTSLTIDGPGASGLAVSGNDASRVFVIDSGVTATISGLTIEDGSVSDANGGGGIENLGTLTVADSVLSANSVGTGTSGGAIANNGGTLVISDSTMSGNSAGIDGGAIENGGGAGGGVGTVTISDSTVSDNTASGNGGGIENGGTLTVSDSTISGNSDTGGGGAIFTIGGTVNVSHSTLSGNKNEETYYGIIQDNCCTVNLTSTIVANSTGSDCAGFVAVPVTDYGYNLADDNSCSFSPVNHSISGSTTVDLGPLANNGGLTETLLPAATSSAVGVIPTGTTLNGVQVCPRVDQRGVASVGNCTIGAVEVDVCSLGLTPHVLTATYANSTFVGLFCVNAKGFGTYTQGALSGFGWVTVVKGTTVIAALGKNLLLAGSTNGTKSSFLELAPAPSKFGTFTLS